MRARRSLLLLPAAAVLLASCGSGGDTGDAPATEDQPAAESNAGSSEQEDQADDAEQTASENDVEADSGDSDQSGAFAPEGAIGGSLSGAVYTLGAPKAVADDVADALRGVDLSEDEVANLRVIPVEIDNSQGNDSEGASSATAVTDDGTQHEYDSLPEYLFQVSDEFAEKENSGLGDPPFDAVVELRDDMPDEVAPTATETMYLVIDDEDDPDAVKFTHFEIQPPMLGDPIPINPVD